MRNATKKDYFMKKLLLFSILFICILLFCACEFRDESYYLYETDSNGDLTIVGISETYSKKLKIPEKIDGKTVTAIGDFAFYNNDKIRSIELPDTILTIGECAFADSDNLNTVIVGKSCQSIDVQAFEGCVSLKKIDISDSKIETIGDLAFSGCLYLSKFDPPSTLTEIGTDAFNECEQVVFNVKNCPAALEYANENHIPTDFSDTDNFLIIKILVISFALAGIFVLISYFIKKRKKSN